MDKKNLIVTFGEIMWRISPDVSGKKIIQTDSFNIEPGGSESNVSIALSQLGNKASFVTKLPEGILADKMLRYLQNYGVDISNISFGGKRIGMYWTETGSDVRASQVLYDREGSSFSQMRYEDFDWNTILKHVGWFHFSGISSAVSKEAAEVMDKIVNTLSIETPISIDLNYRSKLWKWVDSSETTVCDVMKKLCNKAFFLIGNESDFFNSLGIGNGKEYQNDNYLDVVSECFNQFPNLKYVGVSLRNSISASENEWSGLLYVKEKGRITPFKGKTYRLTNITDRVGTGDSFSAGLIHGLINCANDYQYVVDFAVALSALNHSVFGDASQFNVQEVNHLLNDSEGRIIR